MKKINMEYEKTYCIYNKKDWGGVVSGAVVKNKFPDVILIGWDYGDPSPIGKIQPKSRVFVVDLCLEIDDMLKLKEKCLFYWCDHHRKNLSIPELKHIRGNRAFNASSCMLTYEFLNDYKGYPKGIILLSQYYIRDNSIKDDWNNLIVPFQRGMRQYPLDPNHEVVTKILNDDKAFVDDTIKQGLS